MSAASEYLADKVLDSTLGTTPFTAATTVYLALFTSNGSDELEDGTLTNEVSGTNYARVAAAFDAASVSEAANSGDLTFATAGSGGWGTINFVAIMDGDTEGSDNVLYWSAVTTPKTIDDGDTFQITAGNLTVTLA